MIHLDLFSGIGGFALAADWAFGDVDHIFCDTDNFCRAVLHKHWPESYIYEDIRQITSDTNSPGSQGENTPGAQGQPWTGQRVDLLTGGFPCQPFSAAGLRRGTADERHLWPEMLRVIKLTQPTWVIAENVRGLLTWDQGMVFEQVCLDLEASGYEVQPFIIPAVAVNAPHRRDRIWFVANAPDLPGRRGAPGQDQGAAGKVQKRHEVRQSTKPNQIRDIADASSEQAQMAGQSWKSDWSRNWSEVAAELCGVYDGLPVELDGLKLTHAQHRKSQLKAYGNAIVPQVAMQIMEAMK